MRERWRPPLRTVLLGVNLVILLLPLGGLWVLRLFENELVRRTEGELIAQAALLSETYRDLLAEELRGAAPDSASAFPTRPAAPGHAPPADDEPFHPVVAHLDLFVDPVLPRTSDARPASAPAHPAAVRAGERLSVVLRRAQSVTLTGVRIVDVAGVIVASSREEIGLSILHREEVGRALEGERVSLMRERVSDEPPPALSSISRGSQVRVFVALPVADGSRVLGAVVVSRTPLDIVKALHDKRHHILAGSATLLALVLLVSAVTARTITWPVTALIEQARAVARGDREASASVAHAGTREIAELSDSVAGMAQALEQRSDYIRTFAASVSHEFKTPLTAIRGAVELLRDHGADMAPEQRERFLANVLADTERLTRLTKRLLDLARAESFEAGGAAVEVGPVIAAAAERARVAGQEVALSGDAAPLRAAIAEEVLDTVVTGLLDNARQHAGTGAPVSVTCTATDRCVVITVADGGPGVPPSMRERIFEPFFTTAREIGGTGLGLSVIRALLLAHGGEVRFVDAGRGAVFEVTIPRAG